MVVAVLACRTWVLALLLGCISLCAAEQPSAPSPAEALPALSSPSDLSEDESASARPHSESASDALADDTIGARPSSGIPQLDLPPAPATEQRSERFQWKPALAQYGLEISIQHAWHPVQNRIYGIVYLRRVGKNGAREANPKRLPCRQPITTKRRIRSERRYDAREPGHYTEQDAPASAVPRDIESSGWPLIRAFPLQAHYVRAGQGCLLRGVHDTGMV